MDIQQKILELTNRWKGKIPLKYSAEYWRYRADQNYYLSLKSKLESATKKTNV